MKKAILYSLLAFGLTSCLTKTTANYLSPDFATEKTSHKRMAILPFKITRQSSLINLQDPNLSHYPYIAQKDVFSSLINQQNGLVQQIDFQDIDRSNALISKAGISYADLMYMDKADICKLLGVDVVLSGQMELPNEFDELKNKILGVIGQTAFSSSQNLKMSISIHEAKQAKLLWKNDTECDLQLGLESSVKLLNKRLAKSFPYLKQGS